MREDTIYASGRIRGCGSILLFIHLVVGILMIIFGAYQCFIIGNYSGSILGAMPGIAMAIGGLVFIFFGYVMYVILHSIATVIENTDKTSVVMALNDINETLAKLKTGAKDEKDALIEQAVKTVAEMQDKQ